MSLHLIFSSAGWRACRIRAQDEDQIVMLGDGVYSSTDNLPARVLMLDEDLKIRGLSGSYTNTIDYPELVRLCVEHHPVVSWNE